MRISVIGSPATLNIVPFSLLMKLKNQLAAIMLMSQSNGGGMPETHLWHFL